MPPKGRPAADVDELLARWEEAYKKGLLSFWILLLLHERPAYAYEVAAAVARLSQGTLSADENSIYRALNRFEDAGILTSDLLPSNVGPPRRYYRLTDSGKELLAIFIQRNILVFETPEVAERIRAVVDQVESPSRR